MLLFLIFAQVDSLSLEQAIDLAFTNSPAYYESKATLDKSRILFYQSISSLLPTTTTTGTYTNSEISGIATSTYTGAIQFTLPAFDMDVISAILASNRTVKSSGLQHKFEISNLILRLKTAYYSLINARQLLKSSTIAIDRALENMKLAKTKYELGAASKLDLLQGEVFYLRAMQDKSKAKTLEISAQEELKSILGTGNEIITTDSLVTPEDTELLPLDSLIDILEKINYNIQTVRELSNIAKLNLISSYLAFLPKVSLFYGYNVSSDSLIFDFQYCKDNATRNYGISVSIPIFEIKTLIFNYLKAKKDYELQEYTRKRVRLETEKALRTTYYALKESSDKLRFAQKSLDAATEAATIAREQYALGAISFLDFLTAEQDIYEARVSFTSALSDLYIQQANFSYHLGKLALNKE
jgi:outer membrane protein TolC